MTRIFGIDLGTTNSLIAAMDGGQPRVLGGAAGSALLPSVVALSEQRPAQVGAAAIALEPMARRSQNSRDQDAAGGNSAHDCADTHDRVDTNDRVDTHDRVDTVVVRSVKRYMGLGGDELAPEDRRRYSFADVTGPVVRFQVGERRFTPPQIAAAILRELKRRAEAERENETVERVVITVPAYFNDAQRQATKDAGRLAGLEVVRLVNEPTAASLAYGLQAQAEGMVAVYDFGGGTFDISILNIKGGIFEVLATNGDTHLGGDDLDRALIETLLADEPALLGDRAAWNSARAAAESVKQQLSKHARAEFRLDLPGRQIARTVGRDELEKLAEPLIARTLGCCSRALADAAVAPSAITAVVLVGGSTRMPLVRRRVEEFFGREPLCTLDPDQVVALGAAVQAGILMGTQGDLLLLDVVPLSLGIETMGGVMERVIHRNTTIPTSATERFTTAVDEQTHVDVHVLQGERELAADCRSLARFKLGPLSAQAAGVPRIEVTFLIDANGILNVTARDQRTSREHSIDVKPSYGLTDEDIERMLEESIDLGEEDLEQRLLIAARNDADQILAALYKQLREYRGLVDEAEVVGLEQAAAELERVRRGDNRELIASQVERLNELSTPFAERIMDHAIKLALEKKSIEELT